jgi:hypothetical protein
MKIYTKYTFGDFYWIIALLHFAELNRALKDPWRRK